MNGYAITLVQDGISIAIETGAQISDECRATLLLEFWRDFEDVLAQDTAMYPEHGPPIDPTPEGPLGSLWHKSPQESANNSREDAPGHESSSENSAAVHDSPTQSSSTSASLRTDAKPVFPEEGYLYKYVTIETLFRVLETSKLKFSRISSFNDPFDGQLLPVRKFGWKQFFVALRSEIESLISNSKESVYQLPENFPIEETKAAAATLARKIIDGGKSVSVSPNLCDDPDSVEHLSKFLKPMIYLGQQGVFGTSTEAIGVINGLLNLFENQRVPFHIHESDRRIIPAMSDIIQVLCLSEVPDSTLMWAHYANHHTGAVLKFDTSSDSAGYFASARPITYKRELPGYDTPRNLAREYLGLSVDHEQHWDRQFFTKGDEWSYEKEWRILPSAKMREEGDFLSFDPGCLAGIYLGCRVPRSAIGVLIDLIYTKRYSTDLYVAEKDDFEFALTFVPVMNGRTRTAIPPSVEINRRASFYRKCLDAYFDFWNESSGGEHGFERARIRLEGMLADYGPPGSHLRFREMMSTLSATAAGPRRITADPKKEPSEYRRQRNNYLRPSARAYGELEDMLRDDLAARGAALPQREDAAESETEFEDGSRGTPHNE